MSEQKNKRVGNKQIEITKRNYREIYASGLVWRTHQNHPIGS